MSVSQKVCDFDATVAGVGLWKVANYAISTQFVNQWGLFVKVDGKNWVLTE